MDERRRFSRISSDAPVRLEDTSGTWDGRLLDISLKGALIAPSPAWRPAPGADCTLTLVLAEDVTLRLAARVVHHDTERAGLAFLRMPLEAVAHLRRLAELNLGEPERVIRELAQLGG